MFNLPAFVNTGVFLRIEIGILEAMEGPLGSRS
jgi:hypothetical protein